VYFRYSVVQHKLQFMKICCLFEKWTRRNGRSAGSWNNDFAESRGLCL